jgi:hypothetical protein
MRRLQQLARYWKTHIIPLAGRASHLDTALSQISQMKNEILERDSVIAVLQEKLNSTKKTINTKKSNAVESIVEPVKPPTDDF